MVERYAVAGGMPLYLRELGRDRLETRVCRSVLDPRGPLFDEPRAILSQELREPRMYFTILEQLSAGDRTLGELAGALRTTASGLTVYLETLQELRIVARRVPITAPRTARDGHYRLLDPFIAFWFRFVFPYQEDLAAGLDPRRHYRAVIAPRLAEHVAPTFEEICREWARRRYGDRAQRFGPWWGRALDGLRARGARSSEEIDVVGTADRRVTVVGECRWRGRPVDLDVLRDLDAFKVPALRQGGVRVSRDLEVLLFSRNGFTARLREEARRRGNVRLVELAEVVGG
jgi:AAA+ ATPase superfamily predicted ATPase